MPRRFITLNLASGRLDSAFPNEMGDESISGLTIADITEYKQDAGKRKQPDIKYQIRYPKSIPVNCSLQGKQPASVLIWDKGG